MSNRSSFDVAVVGGGVIGLSVAWRAAQRGLRVAVLERELVGGATSRVAAGMLAPVTEVTLVEQRVLSLGLASAQRYPSFVSELEHAAGMDTGYYACGTLLLARDRDEAEALERELRMRRDLGLAVRRLRGSEARRLEPSLAPSLRLALEVEGDHAIDPRRLTAALAQAVRRTGADLREGAEVAAVEPGAVRLSSRERVEANQVVIATGSRAGDLTGIPDHARVPLRPVKGQILRLHDPAGPGLIQRVVRMAQGYIVPRGDGRYVLGATMEERGYDTSVTAGAVFELLRDATELIPGISEFVIDELAAGLRPATPDNLPAIGPGAVSGLHWAVGHYRNGILLAPVTAEIVVGGLIGEEPDELAKPFAPERFTPAAIEV